MVKQRQLNNSFCVIVKRELILVSASIRNAAGGNESSIHLTLWCEHRLLQSSFHIREYKIQTVDAMPPVSRLLELSLACNGSLMECAESFSLTHYYLFDKYQCTEWKTEKTVSSTTWCWRMPIVSGVCGRMPLCAFVSVPISSSLFIIKFINEVGTHTHYRNATHTRECAFSAIIVIQCAVHVGRHNFTVVSNETHVYCALEYQSHSQSDSQAFGHVMYLFMPGLDAAAMARAAATTAVGATTIYPVFMSIKQE